MPETPQPTDAELGVLHVLWETGPATVKDVHARVSRQRELGYTAVLKLMQTMHAKGLVRRDDSERAHRYWAVTPKARTQSALLADFLDRVFAGSARDLVQTALQGRRLTATERAAVRALLEDGKS